MRRRLSDENTDEDKGVDPRVFFESMDQSEAKDGHHIRYDGNNDDTNSDTHGVARDSAEYLANNDIIDDCKATTHDDVEDATQLGAPEAKRVS